MTINLPKRALGVLIVGILSAGVLVAAHEPANKTNVAAAANDVQFVEDSPTPVTLLEETLRVSKPTDLVLSVTAECSILSRIKTVGSDDVSTEGQLEFHIEIDGTPVPVVDVEDPETEHGQVVFCDRVYERTTVFSEDEDASIEDFLSTRTANAFNWVALDASQYDEGDGLLHVVVYATYSENNDPTDGDFGAETPETAADSEGVVGNRTLVITPTMAKHDETLGSDT